MLSGNDDAKIRSWNAKSTEPRKYGWYYDHAFETAISIASFDERGKVPTADSGALETQLVKNRVMKIMAKTKG